MKTEDLLTVLNSLHESSPDLTASAVVSVDGLPIVSVMERTIDQDRVGTLSAALLSLCHQTARLLSCGRFDQMTIEGEDGRVLLMQIDEHLAIVCTARGSARVGLALVQMRQAVRSIREHLDQ